MDPGSIRWERVRRLTVVPFLPDGRCALIPVAGGLALPSGEVLAGEDPVLDTGLRVPLVTAGFRRQGLHPFAVSGDHAVVWSEGDDGYRGPGPTPRSSSGRARRPRPPAGCGPPGTSAPPHWSRRPIRPAGSWRRPAGTATASG
jgi:hypothetical protein